MGNKIVIIGSSNVDLIMKMDKLPDVGETITNATFMQVYGGKGANQAVAAARAGGDVAFVNCVGNDAYTPQMVKNFEADGIDTRFVFKQTEMPSGHALVMIGPQGNNYLSVAPGANYALTPKHIKDAEAVIKDAAMLLMQCEIKDETIEYVLDLANELGIPVMWNFAPAKKFNLEYCKKVAILVVNESEAEYLCNKHIKTKEDAEAAIQELLKLGPKTVILTLGTNGLVYSNGEGVFHCPAFKVDAVDATAAGDVFCGSLAVAHNEGKLLKEALLFASAAAALCVTKMGAQPSIPLRAPIDSFLKKN